MAFVSEIAKTMNDFASNAAVKAANLAAQGTELVGAHAEGNILVADMIVHNWDRYNAYEEALKNERIQSGMNEEKIQSLINIEKIADNRIIIRIDHAAMMEEITKVFRQ